MTKCIVCHNETKKQLITFVQEYNGSLVAIQGVPAEVCSVCGEQYFAPKDVDEIQRIVSSQKTKKRLHIPLYELNPTSTKKHQKRTKIIPRTS